MSWLCATSSRVADPALVALGHGSRDPRAAETTELLLDAVRSRLPSVAVTAAYLDHAPPSLADVVATLRGPAVVVPLLLATGYHVGSDVPADVEQARATGAELRLAEPLGPDDLVVDALVDRARAVLSPGVGIVLLSATGSARQSANDEVADVAARLGQRLGVPTRAVFVSAGEPRLPDALARAADAVVVPYLLAPGRILDAVERACATTVPVAPVLGHHPAIAELVVRRYRG